MSKIKICGLTREADIAYVNASVPDYAGFVFAESRRRVSFERAAELRRALDTAIVPVGVFVNAALDDVICLYETGVISIAQLHGGERSEYIEALKSHHVPVIQAIRFGRGDVISASADYYLFDSPSGGTGTAFDWSGIPKTEKPYFLAGGISTENIADALKLKPYAVDVSSGAETDGLKDAAKIDALIKIVREAK